MYLISRFIQEENDYNGLIPRSKFIPNEKYIELINGNSKIQWYHEFEFKIIAGINYCISKGERLFSLEYINGRIHFYLSEETDEIFILLADIALYFNAFLLSDPATEIPDQYIYELHEKILSNRVVYQKESFGGNNTWLTIKASEEDLLKYFKVKKIVDLPWSDAILKMRKHEGLFLFHFDGWSFLAGELIYNFFKPLYEGEEKREKQIVNKLLEWGTYFSDVQLNIFDDYHNGSIGAYYRILDGKLVFGIYNTELLIKAYQPEETTYRRISFSSRWSYDPDDLRYNEELKDAQAKIIYLK